MSASEGLLTGIFPGNVIEDEEEERYGRLLSFEEFIAVIRSRADIFAMEQGSRLSRVEAISLCLAVIVGLIFTSVNILTVRVPMDIPIQSVQPGHITVAPSPLLVLPTTYQTTPRQTDDRFTLKPPAKTVSNGNGQSQGGVGSPSSRIARMKIFTMVSNFLSGNKTGGEPEGNSLTGIQNGIDMIISGNNSIKHGGSMSAGRRTENGIGTANGTGLNGYHGGIGDGLGDPLSGLLGPQPAQLEMRPMNHDHSIENIGRGATTVHAGSIIGGRSRSSIMHTVMDNLPALRYAYNRWLRSHPGATGKITLKFAIDEFGTVIYCEEVGTTIADPYLSRQIVSLVRTWNFGKIDKPGDITEAVYPLVFSL